MIGKKVRAIRGLETTLSMDVFANPMGIALDVEGNLLVADTGHYVVKRLPGSLLE